MAIVFLDLEDLFEIHRDLVGRYGGGAGVRDLGLLESALAAPRAGMGGAYFHADLPEMAAALLFHLVRNHPFLDGNKRAGALAAFVFLALNGVALDAPEAGFESLVRSIAEGRGTKEDATRFLRKHAKA
jgi:death-on-curing protein